MERKAVSGIMLTLMLMGMLTLAFNIQLVYAVPRTWTVDDDGPADFHKIQDAINMADPGDTIFVRNGTYQENLIVNKNNLIIVGEDKVKTIIQVFKGTTVTITGDRVVFKSFTVYGSAGWYPDCTINMEYAVGCNITNNIVASNIIRLGYSSDNILSGNNLTHAGLFLEFAFGNIVSQNCIYSNNERAISLLNSSMNLIDSNNLTGDVGIYLLYSSFNNIFGNNITVRAAGIHLEHGSNNIIHVNYIKTDNIYGECTISFGWASNNYVYCNTIIGTLPYRNYTYYMRFYCSSNDIFYHNNFLNKTHQIISYNSTNVWDDGYPSGGNYWSDYTGIDLYKGPYQNETGGDGIGDSPYIIDANNVDHYPLMELYPYSYGVRSLTITAAVGGTTYPTPGTHTYFEGTLVAVTAIPGANYNFAYWELDGVYNGTNNPTTVLMDKVHTLKAVFSQIPPLSASLSPPSSSLLVGESVTFTSTVSGGRPPYNYQWYLNNNPVPGVIANTWIFTPTITGSFTVYLNVTDSLGNSIKSNEAAVTVAPPLSISICPMSASTIVSQSVIFTSTVLGGYTPYGYQWYLNGAPVLGATSNTWTFTPTTSGIYYVYLTVTDAKSNTIQSETARIAVVAVPVGGYSIPIKGQNTPNPLTLYLALIAILATVFTAIRRKIPKKITEKNKS